MLKIFLSDLLFLTKLSIQIDLRLLSAIRKLHRPNHFDKKLKKGKRSHKCVSIYESNFSKYFNIVIRINNQQQRWQRCRRFDYYIEHSHKSSVVLLLISSSASLYNYISLLLFFVCACQSDTSFL